MKAEFKKRFKKAYPKQRLLAVQLNGFSHRVVYDAGTKDSPVKCDEFSGCMPEGNWSSGSSVMFAGVGHNEYQGKPKEIIYVLPEGR